MAFARSPLLRPRTPLNQPLKPPTNPNQYRGLEASPPTTPRPHQTSTATLPRSTPPCPAPSSSPPSWTPASPSSPRPRTLRCTSRPRGWAGSRRCSAARRSSRGGGAAAGPGGFGPRPPTLGAPVPVANQGPHLEPLPTETLCATRANSSPPRRWTRFTRPIAPPRRDRPRCRSVPSGRVGAAREAVFRSNDHFREALADREAADVADLEGKMGRKWVLGVAVGWSGGWSSGWLVTEAEVKMGGKWAPGVGWTGWVGYLVWDGNRRFWAAALVWGLLGIRWHLGSPGWVGFVATLRREHEHACRGQGNRVFVPFLAHLISRRLGLSFSWMPDEPQARRTPAPAPPRTDNTPAPAPPSPPGCRATSSPTLGCSSCGASLSRRVGWHQ